MGSGSGAADQVPLPMPPSAPENYENIPSVGQSQRLLHLNTRYNNYYNNYNYRKPAIATIDSYAF